MFNTRSFLSHVFLFETLSPSELDTLSSFCSAKKLKKDEILFREEQLVDAFYIIAFGKIKLFCLTPSGGENVIHHQVDGDLIAEAAIFNDESYPASAVAMEESLLVRVPSENFKNLLRTNPELCFKIMSAYTKRLRFLAKKIQELTLNDIKGRVANFLLSNQEGNKVCLHISKKELASTLGTIPETLSRTFQGLKKQGLIEVHNKEIIILDPQGLKSLIV